GTVIFIARGKRILAITQIPEFRHTTAVRPFEVECSRSPGGFNFYRGVTFVGAMWHDEFGYRQDYWFRFSQHHRSLGAAPLLVGDNCRIASGGPTRDLFLRGAVIPQY